MLHMLLSWLFNAAIILLVAQLVPGIRVKDFNTSLAVAAVLGVLNLLLGYPLTWVATLITGVLTFPLVILSLGLWVLIVYWVMSFLAMLFTLWLTATIVPGFTIFDSKALVFGAILISIFTSLLHHVF